MKLKVLLAALAAAVVAFILGWIIYGFVLMDFMQKNTISYQGLNKENMNLLLIFISNLVYGLLVAWVYNKYEIKKSVGMGACIGATIGLLLALGVDLMFLASYNLMNLKGTIADVLGTTIIFAAMGATVGLILKPKKENV